METYLYNYVNTKDIVAPTEDYKGINCLGEFNPKSLYENFEEKIATKYVNRNMAFFAHMPLWLVRERLKPLNKKLKFNIFDNFFKFTVIRNPYDLCGFSLLI